MFQILLVVVALIALAISTYVKVLRAQELADRAGRPRGSLMRQILNANLKGRTPDRMEEETYLRVELDHYKQFAARGAQPQRPTQVAPSPQHVVADRINGSSEQRLQEVQRLYEQGLINEDEASTKRREILDEL